MRPLQPHGEGWHGLDGVVSEERHQPGRVVALEGVDIVGEQVFLVGVNRRSGVARRWGCRSR